MIFKKLTARGENILYAILVLIGIALVLFEERLFAIEHSVRVYLRHFW